MPDKEDSTPVAGDIVHGDKPVLSGDFRGGTVYVSPTIVQQTAPAPAAPSAPGPRIFLSYAHRDDIEFVDRLEADLRERGFVVWRDLPNMPSAGRELSSEQCDAIDNCDRFVPIIGPEAFERPAVKQEWAYARRKCTPITAVWRLGNVMPEDFGRLRYFDFRANQPGYNYDATLAALADKLRQAAAPGKITGDWREPPDTAITRREMAQLATLLRDVPVMSVTGRAAVGAVHAPGGVGKTVLAGLFSRDCRTRWHFRDGILWVEVGQSPTETELQLRLGRLLGDTGPGAAENYRQPAEGRDRLAALLDQKWVLIVLDDVWDHSHVRDLIVAADNCRWLITTRKVGLGTALGLGRERIVALDYLTDEEGLALIASVLGWAESGDHPERDDHLKIVRELGGHAQAVAIAASLLRPVGAFTPDRWLGRFREKKQRGDALDELTQVASERERNVNLSFAVSYDELSEADRRRFRALGAFAPEGSFGVGVVIALWGDVEMDAEDALARLVDRSLLSRTGNGRYSQHALLRAYALAWLKREGEEVAARGRHFGYYATEYANEELNRGYQEVDRHDRISADFDNIRHGLEWALDAKPVSACNLIDALEESYMQLRQPARVCRELLLLANNAAKGANYQRGEANTVKALGDVHLRLDEYLPAYEAYSEALDIFQIIGDRLNEANTIKALGDVQLRQGNYRGAKAMYEQAQPMFAAVKDSLGEANTIRSLGNVHLLLGENGTARARYKEAQSLYIAISDRLGAANTTKALGDVHFGLAEYDAAQSCYEEAWSGYASIGARLGEANTLKALGDVHLQLAAYELARARYEEARPIYAEIGARLGEVSTIKALEVVHLKLEEYEQAQARGEEARLIFNALSEEMGSGNMTSHFGDIFKSLIGYEVEWASYQETHPIGIIHVRLARAFSNVLSPPILIALTSIVMSVHELSLWPGMAWGIFYASFVALVPILIVVGLLRAGYIKDLDMSTTFQRLLPYVTAVLAAGVAYSILTLLDGPLLLQYLSIVTIIAYSVLALLNTRWLISIHSTIAASMLLMIALVFGWVAAIVLFPLVFLICYVRLYLKRHTLAQVLAGCIIGALTVLLVVL